MTLLPLILERVNEMLTRLEAVCGVFYRADETVNCFGIVPGNVGETNANDTFQLVCHVEFLALFPSIFAVGQVKVKDPKALLLPRHFRVQFEYLL